MATASTATLVDSLRQYRLLEPAQLEEVKTFQFPDPKALARELMQRGWLTPYQANQLLQGKGQELVLGSYMLLERLGEGGMGQAFKARHRNLGRIVAVKLIRKERLDNPAAIKRFEREVRAAAALNHPNIVRAYDADQIGGTHLLVMECVEGATDLNRLVKKNGPLPVEQACEYIRQAALGLQHAHERGLVHRDIKPHNLLLTGGGKTVKVLDMGLARLDHSGVEDDNSSTMTQEGAVMGTPDYIAPEQALESHTVDIRADLYSLGCTYYFLLTGKAPFPGGTFIQKINKHQFEEPKPVDIFRPDVPPGVSKLVQKLMAKKPEDRYQTPAEVAAALATVFSIQSETSLAASRDDRTVAEDGRAKAKPSEDTLDSAFSYMAKGGDTLAMDAPAGLRRKEGKRRWLLVSVMGVAIVLIGVVFLMPLLKEPSENEPPENGKHRPVVKQPAIPITPANKPPAKVEDAWIKQVATMPAEKQVQAVAAKLKELNPGFDGKVTHKAEGGVVTELRFFTDNVTDISPVRALEGLKELVCGGRGAGKGKVSDLSPLKGLKLTELHCEGTQVSDLSPLKGMPLTYLNCGGTQVFDLSPLKATKLTVLHCYETQVSDLSPLKDMKLTVLHCEGTQVSDLSPLKNIKLTELWCHNTKVTDLSPLKGIRLMYLHCDFKPFRDTEILRSIKTLEEINYKLAKEFWKEVEGKQAGKKP